MAHPLVGVPRVLRSEQSGNLAQGTWPPTTKEFTLKIILDENGIVSARAPIERYISCMELQNQHCPEISGNRRTP
jgi:hypothetical protein